MSEDLLSSLLLSTFGHRAFRPSQEDVCRRIAAGEDLLLVMPTGAGKSLCYQLPGLARGGTTLVVSPLVSLIEDQVQKLQAAGVKAERIHSGLDRSASRDVCRRYLAGELSFLFVAPERLAVPGFPEMLAKRPLALVAIDEAHCISHWGHDFRPEYRMLGGRLPMFRPAPIVALTATATPEVQSDIMAQLGVPDATRIIRGFRRENLRIEVMPLSPSRRVEVITELVSDRGRLPAIVYVQTRKEAESLAAALAGSQRAEAYHAGLPAESRDRVQRGFQEGQIELVIATVAFGMGIDKANVRLVVHAGLPASLEGYYQEIGRAGRDGQPANVVLLYSFADKRTHEFLLSRSYPELTVLDDIYAVLNRGARTRDSLREKVDLEEEVFERAIEQLWVHGAVRFDTDDIVLAVPADYASTYTTQRDAKFAQLTSMFRYAESPTCRMAALVHHFGDERDAARACGVCDVCNADVCIAREFADSSPGERAVAERLEQALVGRSQTVGQLARSMPDVPRDTFAHVLEALVRAQRVTSERASFERDGKRVEFTRIRLVGPEGISLPPSKLRITKAPRPLSHANGTSARGRNPGAERTRAGASATHRSRQASTAGETLPHESSLYVALRTWRRDLAKSSRVPAFRILTDRVLSLIAEERPRDVEALRSCAGVGATTLRRYGGAIVAIVAENA